MTRTTTSSKLSVKLSVAHQTLMDLLTTAVESGGSSMWADFTDPIPDAGCYDRITVSDSEGTYRQQITATDLLIGLQKMADSGDAPALRHLLDALTPAKMGMWTADVVLQWTCFGKVIYG